MAIKIKDERFHQRELYKIKEIKKKRLGEQHHPKTKKYKKVIQFLRQEAEETKRKQNEKFEEKIKHIERKYRETEEEKMLAPPSMKEMSSLSVFNKEQFEEIRTSEVHVPLIGEVYLSADEEKILKRNPKFAIPQNLYEDTMREEMEKAYSLIRMELRDEDEEEIEQSTGEKNENNENKQKEKEQEARARQVFCPVEKRYDERKRRVTDLVECSRVTLPKPLSTVREAQIEVRREVHDRIFQEYRREHCNQQGEQETNLMPEEKRGLESLLKRIKKENLIIMKTDKSGKMSVTTEEKYREMGQVHIGEDKKINREKIRELDKTMNEHSRAWCNMWNTGKDHSQEDRIQNSKTSKSENRAKLYLAYKDHKKNRQGP